MVDVARLGNHSTVANGDEKAVIHSPLRARVKLEHACMTSEGKWRSTYRSGHLEVRTVFPPHVRRDHRVELLSDARVVLIGGHLIVVLHGLILVEVSTCASRGIEPKT